MDELVLGTIKSMLGVDSEESAFDTDIIAITNSVLMSLAQMGVVETGTMINPDTEWSDIIGENSNLEGIKTYLYIKVKNIFDPPTSSSVQQAMNSVADELQWRMYISKDNQSTVS